MKLFILKLFYFLVSLTSFGSALDNWVWSGVWGQGCGAAERLLNWWKFADYYASASASGHVSCVLFVK